MDINGKNIFQNIVDAFEDLSVFLSTKFRAAVVGILFLIFVTSFFLLSFWIYKNITLLNEESVYIKNLVQEANPTPEKMQELLEKTNTQNVLIDRVLTDDILPTGVDRAYLVRFHNGNRDINGTHFMYMSTSNEVTASGVPNQADAFQSIPTSFFPNTWISSLLEGECIVNLPDTIEKDKPIRSRLLSLGTKKMELCPIIGLENGNLLGVVGASWVNDLPSTEDFCDADEALRYANGKLSAILSVE